MPLSSLTDSALCWFLATVPGREASSSRGSLTARGVSIRLVQYSREQTHNMRRHNQGKGGGDPPLREECECESVD
jgi:hypothetical protein